MARFQPPRTKEEFQLRANKLTLSGARSMLGSLNARRNQMTQDIDKEIEFYKKAVNHLEIEEQNKNNRTIFEEEQ